MSRVTTMIGPIAIPLRYLHLCAVYEFIGGPKPGDAGVYAFWTALLKRPTDGRGVLTVRAKVGLAAGERFARIGLEARARHISKEARVENARTWAALAGGANVRYVRPATLTEIEYWLLTHPLDADHARDLREDREAI